MIKSTKGEQMASEPIRRKWTVEEYLLYEEETHTRFEYIDGEIYAMSGGTHNHSLIKMNIGSWFTQKLRGKRCRAYDNDMKIKVSDIKYLYPDISVVCGKPIYDNEKRTMLKNPTLIIEVLSPSTEKYDRTTKFDYYRSMPSLQAYVIVDSRKLYVGIYQRQDNGWLLQEYHQLDQIVPLDVIDCSLPLSEVYYDISFDEESG